MSEAEANRGPVPVRRGPLPGSRGRWDNYVEWYKPTDLDAPHAPDRDDDLATITASMNESGWSGRPLLAARYDEAPLTCQTGSHRLSAARTAGLSEVPVVVIDCASALEGEDASMNVFDLMIECASRESEELADVVRELWDQDGYPQG
jgi:hypothetical protein